MEPDPQILIIDDARAIREPLGTSLRRQRLRTQIAANAGEARRLIDEAVILDVMMPGEDGLSRCRWLMARGGPPVILLTAMADETDRFVWRELGADEYVVKPFNPRVLLARIRAVLHGAPPPKVASGRRRFAGWAHDAAAHTLRH